MAREKICGIYKITNKINGKCYIGQSVDIYKRWEYYRYNKRDKTPILQSIKKYGIDNFLFEVIETVEDRLNLCEKEKMYISELNTICPSGYNLSSGGRKTTWAYKPSEETLKKRSIALTGQKRTQEVKDKMSKAQKGKVITQEHRDKIRNANKGKPSPMRGKKKPQEQVEKMRKSKIGKPAYWRFSGVKRSDGMVFKSITAAAIYTGCDRTSIHRVINGQRNSVYGYKFFKIDKNGGSDI